MLFIPPGFYSLYFLSHLPFIHFALLQYIKNNYPNRALPPDSSREMPDEGIKKNADKPKEWITNYYAGDRIKDQENEILEVLAPKKPSPGGADTEASARTFTIIKVDTKEVVVRMTTDSRGGAIKSIRCQEPSSSPSLAPDTADLETGATEKLVETPQRSAPGVSSPTPRSPPPQGHPRQAPRSSLLRRLRPRSH